MLDQNALPKHSMGEDWGAGNLDKAFVAMKNFQMLPIDSTVQNTEAPLSFQHYQVLNMEQTARLMSRIQLANYFKQQAFETIGISPERMGAVNAQQSGTNIEQAVNMSYSQTEVYFTQHCEHLMPRVHQMRTDLAQYYHSNNPSVRLSYMTSMDEQVNFEINGTELLGRDFGVFCSTKVNTREIMEKIRSLAINNNTAGASIYDLGNMIKAQSPAELDHALKASDQKMSQQQQAERDSQQSIQQQMDEAAGKRQAELLEFERWKAEGEWQNNLDEAEIKGVGFQTPDDQTDYLDGIKTLEDNRHKDSDRELRRQALDLTRNDMQQKANLKREDMAARERIADKQVRVASINKNRFDKPKPAAKGK